MSKETTNQATIAPSISEVGSAALISTIMVVGNTARALEHTTGILADKAENYRKQIAISDAIEHNALMLQYTKQAKEAGLDLAEFDV